MVDLDVHLSAVAAGDAGAFGRWLAGAEPCLRQSLRSFAARVDTEATLQEALLRTWQVAPRHAPDGRPNSLLRVALRIARNLAIDEARRARVAPMPDEDIEQALAAAEIPQAGSGPDPFLRRAFAAIWEDELNLADAATLIRLADENGLPGKALAERSANEDVGKIYEQNRQDALAADVFGSPAYVLDGEVFWGQDRIELLVDALKSGRAPYRSQA